MIKRTGLTDVDFRRLPIKPQKAASAWQNIWHRDIKHGQQLLKRTQTCKVRPELASSSV